MRKIDIKKALKCCSNEDCGDCTKCPYKKNSKPWEISHCFIKLMRDALNLIEKQQLEIESHIEYGGMMQSEIEHLKENRIRVTECESIKDLHPCKHVISRLVEPLKKYIHSCENISESTDEDLCNRIDEIVKELTDGTRS